MAIQLLTVQLALSQILVKIYKRAIANRMIAISSENSWLSLQFGFRSGKSTIDAIDRKTLVEENMQKNIFTFMNMFWYKRRIWRRLAS